MGIIEIDKLDTLLVRHAELKVAVDAFGQTLNEVQRYANETNIVVKDILTGRQISAWVDDLSASGKNSATYKDASRMNALLGSKDACRNNKVSQHIFDFAVANNKTGTYFGTGLDNTGGVSWAALTTPASVCGNTAAFGALVDDPIAFEVSVNHAVFRKQIYTSLSTTRIHLIGSENALSIMRAKKKRKNITPPYQYYQVEPLNFYIFAIKTGYGNECYLTSLSGRKLYGGDYDYKEGWETLGAQNSFKNIKPEDGFMKSIEMGTTNCMLSLDCFEF